MANEFTTGLLQGFNFVDSIRQRRRQNDMEAQRLTIARAASGRAQAQEDRAQSAFEGNLEDTETIKAGRAAAFDVGDGEPDELQLEMMTAAAALGDPVSITNIENRRRQFGLEQTIQNVRPNQGITDVTGQLSGQQPSGQAGQATEFGIADTPGGNEFVDPSGFEAPPPDEFSPEGSDPAGVRQVSAAEVLSMLPADQQKAINERTRERDSGLAIPRDDFLTDTRSGAQFDRAEGLQIQLPAGGSTEREIMAMDVDLRKDAIDKTTELLSQGGFVDKAQRAESRQASVNEQWVNSLNADVDSEKRDLAATDLPAFVDDYWQDRNAIIDPNDLANLDRQFMAVADKAMNDIATQMEQLPRLPSGFMDLSTDEAQALKTQVDHNIALRQAIQANFSINDEARVRGTGFPVGNQKMVDQLEAAIVAHGEPAKAPTSDKDRVGFAQGRRFTSNPNANEITTGEIKWGAWAVLNGYMEMGDLLNRAMTGSYSTETQRVFTRKLNEEVWQGGMMISAAIDAPDEDLMYEIRSDQEEILRENFLALEGGKDADAGDRARAQRNLNSFRLWINQNIDEIQGINGIDPNLMDPNEAQQLMSSYQSDVKLSNAYNRVWWRQMIGSTFAQDIRTPEDKQRVAQDLGISLVPKPRRDFRTDPAAVQTLRQQYAAGNRTQQTIAAIPGDSAFMQAVEVERSR